MSAIHYMAKNSKFRLTPNRAINAAAEIRMILLATGADGLGTAIINQLETTVSWLEGEVATQIQRVMDEAKAAAATKKSTTVTWPSVEDVAKSTAAQLLELADEVAEVTHPRLDLRVQITDQDLDLADRVGDLLDEPAQVELLGLIANRG